MGKYRFDALMPGVYSIRQTQPEGFFHGGQVIGDQGGDDTADDLLFGLTLAVGTQGNGYDFPEIPPASVSGFVFQDGDQIQLSGGLPPELLRQYSDGLLTSDDLRIEGVKLELRDATGVPVAISDSLPGHYDGRNSAGMD